MLPNLTQLQLFTDRTVYRVIGRREYPCGPHYKKDGSEIKNRVRFSPHPGVYQRVCPTCGIDWRLVIDYGVEHPNVLFATWHQPEDPFLNTITIVTNGSNRRLAEGNVLLDGDGPEMLEEHYRTRQMTIFDPIYVRPDESQTYCEET